MWPIVVAALLIVVTAAVVFFYWYFSPFQMEQRRLGNAIHEAARLHESRQDVLLQLRAYGIEGLLQCSVDTFGGRCPRDATAPSVFDGVSTQEYRVLIERCSPEVLLTFDSNDQLLSGRAVSYCEGF
jgi:hypothetical protein